MICIHQQSSNYGEGVNPMCLNDAKVDIEQITVKHIYFLFWNKNSVTLLLYITELCLVIQKYSFIVLIIFIFKKSVYHFSLITFGILTFDNFKWNKKSSYAWKLVLLCAFLI